MPSRDKAVRVRAGKAGRRQPGASAVALFRAAGEGAVSASSGPGRVSGDPDPAPNASRPIHTPLPEREPGDPKRVVSFAPRHAQVDPSDLYVDRPEPGESAPFSFRIGHDLHACLQDLVAQEVFDYPTKGDIGRAALVFFIEKHLLPMVANQQVSTELKRMSQRIRAVQRMRRLTNTTKFVSEHVDGIVQLLAAGALAMAVEQYMETLKFISEMEDPWSGLAKQKLETDARIAQVAQVAKQMSAAAGGEALVSAAAAVEKPGVVVTAKAAGRGQQVRDAIAEAMRTGKPVVVKGEDEGEDERDGGRERVE